MSEPLIRMDDVTVRYGSFVALKEVSCAVEPGAIGLLGPNGAGKSTFMKTLLGFNRASKGTVDVFGLRMPKSALAVRQRLGYMPEREVSSPKVSAVSFLSFCGRLFGMSRVDAMERCHEVLNYVGLGESRYRAMETYSTGMLQRLKLAQAILHDPDMLLLDEPTNGLDPDSRVEMLELIRDVVKRRGVTLLLSSHLLPDVEHVCERVMIITRGHIVRQGAIEDLTAMLERQYEVRIRENKDRYIAAAEAAGLAWADQQDGKLILTLPVGTPPRALFELAQTSETQVRHFRPARQSLEDVFLDVVAGASTPGAEVE